MNDGQGIMLDLVGMSSQDTPSVTFEFASVKL